jgi:arginyl-tRNA synthetase
VFQEIEAQLARAFEEQLKSQYNLDIQVSIEQPKQASFGELAIPVAFQLARQLKKAPR